MPLLATIDNRLFGNCAYWPILDLLCRERNSDGRADVVIFNDNYIPVTGLKKLQLCRCELVFELGREQLWKNLPRGLLVDVTEQTVDLVIGCRCRVECTQRLRGCNIRFMEADKTL